MKENDTFKVTIIDDNHMGNGIAKLNNQTIFVPKTIKGDIVNIKIEKTNKKIAYAKVVDKGASKKTDCPYYQECGGCDLLHISYEREKRLKENYIKKLFNEFNNSIISFDRNKYRNKVTLHVLGNKIGFYKKESNNLIPINKCLLFNDDINKLIKELNNINLSNIKNITIKSGDNGLLLNLEGNIKNNDLNKLISNNNIKSIYQNNKLIYGDKYLKVSLGNIKYNINHNSFFQINNKCSKALYDKIKEYVGVCNNLLDLYCGTGSIGIYLKNNAQKITGIEINKDSVLCAKQNIVDNNIDNYRILNEDASFIKDKYDCVIVDPPRKGLSKKVINILNEMKSKKIIYVSCNPSTLKRDINLITNYYLKDISVFNMFPATKHIESVCLLELKEGE